MSITENYKKLLAEIRGKATLVAVSKTKTSAEIMELYNLGQRDFGENYVQELQDKIKKLPNDIRWHFIGHLQTNKAKMVVDFVHLVQSVDSIKLLTELDKQGEKNGRVIQCLLQVHISDESTKFGFSTQELEELFTVTGRLQKFSHIKISGLMGMASFTDDDVKIRKEFATLRSLFVRFADVNFSNCNFSILSMGMTADYKTAIGEGSNMIRIGSLLFGERIASTPKESK
ncbi:MAG: YggS family pyridoxal phosphate-dependent enzyme [Ginsengibacter sp.]